MDSPPTSEVLLAWSKEQTKGYTGVNISDFSQSFKDGLALCALIHSLDKNQFQYESLTSQPKEEVLRVAFEYASKIGIPELLGASDLLVPAPDQFVVESYLLSVYHHWQQHQHRLEEKLLAQKLLAAEESKSNHVEQQISYLSEKNTHVGNALRESKQTKGLLVNVEEELHALNTTIERNNEQNEQVKSQISEKTAQLENSIEKERQQYEKEIEKLEKELEELRKKGPSDHQLALKRKLDEQTEKKDRLNRMKQQMEQEIVALKQQLEQDEQKRIQLQARRTQAEQRRSDLKRKHQEELQRLQRDLSETFKAEDSLQTDLLQQNYVKNSLQAETNKLSSDVRSLDGIHTGIVKQNTELKEKKQKLEALLLGAKLYLEEETRVLNFKESDQVGLQRLKTEKTEALQTSYDVKRTKDKEHRNVTTELSVTKETFDKEYLQTSQIKREVSKLEIKSDSLKREADEEVQKRSKKVDKVKEANKTKIAKEDSKYKAKVSAVASQTAALAANTDAAQLALSAEKAKIDSSRTRTEELASETRSVAHSLSTEAASQREASRAQDLLMRELQLANEFLGSDKVTKTKTAKARHRAEDSIKSMSEAVALTEAKKSAIENTKDHLARDYELTKQDLKLAEKDAKKAREDKQKLGEEKEKLKQDIFTEDLKAKPRQPRTTGTDAISSNRRLEERDANGALEQLGQETEEINDKAESLRREMARLTDDTAALQFSQSQAKIAKEGDKYQQEQDRKNLQKLQDHRNELKARLEAIHRSLQDLSPDGDGDDDGDDLLIEEGFVKKRLDDVDKLIRDAIKQL